MKKEENTKINTVKEIKRMISINFDGFVPSELRDTKKISEKILFGSSARGSRFVKEEIGEK